jgi:hypothetical protein
MMCQVLFDDDKTANRASFIMLGIMSAKSPLNSWIEDAIPGSYEANYKSIQHFLNRVNLFDLFSRPKINKPCNFVRPKL